MREFLANLEFLGRDLASLGIDPKRAHMLLMHKTRNAASTKYAMSAYHEARAQVQSRAA